MIPVVSVIMTVRNGARYLQETLEAVGRQSFTDFEFVINDNGSTDATPDILRRYAAWDSRVRLLDRPSGQENTFTDGIARALMAAEAPFVAVNDSDDVSRTDRLEKQVEILQAQPEITVVASSYEEIDSEGRSLATYRVPSSHAELMDAFQCGNPLAHSTIMYRRKEALMVGGYRRNLTYASDFALQLGIIGSGGRIAVIPEPLVKMRIHAEQTSLMQSYPAQRYREPLELLAISSRLSGASWPARLKGMVARQKLALHYGLELWKSGRRAQSVIATAYWIGAALWSPVAALLAHWQRRPNTAAGGTQ
ncbi:MAG: glycosyltransferase [Xanthobacteraceae bacterium]|jgi:glycosyltransferase involved in cell wall biosynthesis